MGKRFKGFSFRRHCLFYLLIVCGVLIPFITCLGGTGHSHGAINNIRCGISFPEAAISDIYTVYIPFSLVGRLMVVQARVDSLSGNFIVDTGSERLLLNQDYYTDNDRGRMIASTGVTGLVSVYEKNIDSLFIDQLHVPDLLAHLVDLSHIEVKKNMRIHGILGYNVFNGFELFIDFPHSRIVMSKVDKKGIRLDTLTPWEIPYDSMSFELRKHLIVMDVMVNNVRIEMILDSGAELNLIDRKVNRKVLDHFTIIKRVNMIGVGKKQVEVLAGTLEEVRCGNQTSKSMNTLLTSLDNINTSLGVSVDGVLGYEFLGKRRTLINYQKRKLYFYRPLRS